MRVKSDKNTTDMYVKASQLGERLSWTRRHHVVLEQPGHTTISSPPPLSMKHHGDPLVYLAVVSSRTFPTLLATPQTLEC